MPLSARLAGRWGWLWALPLSEPPHSLRFSPPCSCAGFREVDWAKASLPPPGWHQQPVVTVTQFLHSAPLAGSKCWQASMGTLSGSTSHSPLVHWEALCSQPLGQDALRVFIKLLFQRWTPGMEIWVAYYQASGQELLSAVPWVDDSETHSTYGSSDGTGRIWPPLPTQAKNLISHPPQPGSPPSV